MSYLPFFFGITVSYLMGSVPFGYLIARLKGVDIRSIGSGNIGATNVYRTLGKGPGILTFSLDMGKGLVAVRLINLLAVGLTGQLTDSVFSDSLWLQLMCGAAALLGHSFPVFLGFQGGKGVATGAGLVLGLAPMAVAGGLIIWLIVFLTGRYVSLASIAAAVAVAALGWILYGDVAPQPLLPAVITVLALLIIVRHHANIGRLLSGTENRFSFKKEKKAKE